VFRRYKLLNYSLKGGKAANGNSKSDHTLTKRQTVKQYIWVQILNVIPKFTNFSFLSHDFHYICTDFSENIA
jgi:hypothetical protein